MENNLSPCPVCSNSCSFYDDGNYDGYLICCENCGNYKITRSCSEILDSKLDSQEKRSILSHEIWIRSQNNGSALEISTPLLKVILENSYLPNLNQQIKNMIKLVGESSHGYGHPTEIDSSRHLAQVGALDTSGLKYVLSCLYEKSIIKDKIGIGIINNKFKTFARFTSDGWEAYERLKKGSNLLQGPEIYMNNPTGNKIFIVHGHDESIKQEVARFVERIQYSPIILHEQANQGRTIIEKFENLSKVCFAIVLLTPDDKGGTRNSNFDEMKPRARQNVVFELGYFFGKIGRNKVVVLHKDEIEKPSDYDGLLYISYDQHGAWKTNIIREMKSAGLEVDGNLIC